MSKGLLKSFAGGEITPELFGRIDLEKFQTGLQKELNFWALPHGPAQNRPGFQYVLESGNSAKKVRVFQFAYSTTQTYMLEFGDQYIRFHTQAGTLLEATKVIVSATKAAQGVLEVTGHGYTTGQWVRIVGGDMLELTGRYAKIETVDADHFKIKHLGVRAFAYLDTSGFTTYTAGGTVARVYQIASPYVEGDLFALNFTQSVDVLSISHPSYDTQELRRLGATNFTLTAATFVPTMATPAVPTFATGGPGGGTLSDHYYAATALKDVTLEESLLSPSTAAVSIDLNVVGNCVDITPAAVANAVRYNIYALKNGLWGFIGQTDGAVLRDSNIAPDVSKTPPEDGATFTGADKRPGCVGYAQGRRVVAGSNSEPQTFFMTRSGTESNMTYSIPTRDDDAIQETIKSQDVQRIRHIMPLGHFALLTTGGAWEVTTVNKDTLTPDSVWPKQRSADGASTVRALMASGSALYVEESGNKLIELTYRQESDGLSAADASVMVPHLFEGHTIVDATYAKSPNRTAWFARDDGVMLGFTYMPEHKVLAWHPHNASGNGLIESVAAVKEGSYYALYAVVKRTINGNSVRYIERLANRVQTNLADYFFVDCGATYSGAAATTIGGSWHLQGETVYALADGAVVGPLVVNADGKITLDTAAAKAHVGYQITADLQTLPLYLERAEAFGQGTQKNISAVILRVYKSSGIQVGPSFDKLRLIPPRTNEPYDSPPALKNDEIRVNIDPKWSLTASLCVRHTDPLPLTVLSITMDSAHGV